jgi:hypothetical protein
LRYAVVGELGRDKTGDIDRATFKDHWLRRQSGGEPCNEKYQSAGKRHHVLLTKFGKFLSLALETS